MASGDHPLLRPAVSLVYAALIAAALIAIDQIVAFMPGAWFSLLAASVVALSVTTVVILSLAGWRRYREGLNRRAAGWAGAARPRHKTADRVPPAPARRDGPQ